MNVSVGGVHTWSVPKKAPSATKLKSDMPLTVALEWAFERNRGGEMLTGEYFHQVDAKGRVRIPPKFKDALGSVMITKGAEGCLFIFSAPQFKQQLEKKMYETDIFDVAGNRQLRTVFSSVFEFEEDNQGRSLLPIALRKFAKIDKDVVFIGVGNRAELWAKEEWDRYQETVGSW